MFYLYNQGTHSSSEYQRHLDKNCPGNAFSNDFIYPTSGTCKNKCDEQILCVAVVQYLSEPSTPCHMKYKCTTLIDDQNTVTKMRYGK